MSDCENRPNIENKLKKKGCASDSVHCYVQYDNVLSDCFMCKNRLSQGDVLSPILFSIYVNE